MSRIGRYMEPEGGPLSWYSTMKNVSDASDRDFFKYSGAKSNGGFLRRVKNLFAKAQDAPLTEPKIQRPGLLGNYGLIGRGGFFRDIQDFFLGKKGSLGRKGNVHAVKRHHHFRHPEEGASRPGFISTAPQQERPGFIAGLGNETAKKGVGLGVVIAIAIVIYCLTMR